ncbi:MAG TPA: M14 family zinc carboxypeptidase [Gaiellaceae bacterium]|nr:M14 family zinc carboxypeptidase [Gaiellaceae bacterium]
MSPRRVILWLCLAAALVVPTMAASTAGAAIEPPWCGTPMPDAAENLPTVGPGAFPHIPYYAIGCTLDAIAAQSNGRMTVERFGNSALGRDKFLVVINALDTKSQRRSYSNWQKIRRYSLDDPERAQDLLDKAGDDVKVPLYIQGGIHGNEYEGVDASMQLIERLATTPYGADPEVDKILDQAILIFNPIQNPDGRIAGARANGNGFDLNRDFLTQSQPETHSSVAVMQEWLPPEMLDLHGYVTPTLIEATTKPHNPGIEYDMWLKWNQSRIDANEAAMNAQDFLVTRPINDWCADGSIPSGTPLVCDDGTTNYGPRWAESWDDWGPFYSPMYSQLVGLNGSTVEMCNQTAPSADDPTRTRCGPLVSDNEKIGRRGSRLAQYITVWSSLLFDTTNRVELMDDQLEIYRRGVNDAPRPTTADLAPITPGDPTDPDIPPGFDNEENNWMVDYPKAYVIPLGEGQRSDPEARRLVQWLLDNGIEVHRMKKDDHDDDDDRGRGSRHGTKDGYVVWMDQAHRGLAYTALDVGLDISADISILYAPPGAWSHGALWGADVEAIPDGAFFKPKTKRVHKVKHPSGDVEGRRAAAYALAIGSPTAVRTVNGLLDDGVSAELATVPFVASNGQQFPAGTVLFPAGAKKALEDAADESGLDFQGVRAPLPAREPIDGSPAIAVLNTSAATDQSVWVLRELGFTANPINLALLNGATDPLAAYDVIFNTAINYPTNIPANATARARLANFFATGGGYLGAGTNGVNFLNNGAQVTGLAAGSNSGGGAGYSGIVSWLNSASGTGLITGAYPESDTAIMDPPTWFTSIPATMTGDGALPLAGFFLSGLWPGAETTPGAPGATVIAHGTNTAGTARLTSFAMNPLYRADPEREWPMLASAALWADQ